MTHTSRISFILNGVQHELAFMDASGPSPFMSLLNYLRTYHGLISVKEGCGVGDCGACTVVLSRPGADGIMTFKAVNACLMLLPMIHGYHVITVEHLSENSILHPLQEAYISHHASQCGFCTPGLIMSSLPLYKQRRVLQDKELRLHLAGNLCRCTGYQPILAAVQDVLHDIRPDRLDEEAAYIRTLLGPVLQDKETMEFHAAGSMYAKVFDAGSALSWKAAHPQAHILAGATDLTLSSKKKQTGRREVLDIADVAEWKNIEITAAGIEIGALVNLEDILHILDNQHPALCNILRQFASVQIRNLATLGGNIAHASPIADSLPVLMASRARVRLMDKSSQRILDLEDFITGYQQTAIREDEILTHILLPPGQSDGTFVRSYKVSRRPDVDISTVTGGFLLRLDRQEVAEIRLFFGGMAAKVSRAKQTEAFLTGKPWTEASIRQAMDILHQEFQPISDVRALAGTRRILAANLLLKFYLELTPSTQATQSETRHDD